MLTPDEVNRQALVGGLVGLLSASEILAGAATKDGKVFYQKGKMELNRMLAAAHNINTALENLFTPGENDGIGFLANDIAAVVRVLAVADMPTRTIIANNFRRQYADLLALHGDSEAPYRIEAEIERGAAARHLPYEPATQNAA